MFKGVIQLPAWNNLVQTRVCSLILICLILTACSNSGVEEELQQTISDVESERDSLSKERDSLRESIISMEESITLIEAEVENLKIDLNSTSAERDTLQDIINETRLDLNSTEAERDSLQKTLSDTVIELETLQSNFEFIDKARSDLVTSNNSLDAQVNELQRNLRNIQAILDTTQVSLLNSENRVQELLSKYDEEIRADLRAEAETEIQRACDVAIERYKNTVVSSIRWDDTWTPVITKAELVTAVEQCAEPGRSNAADVDAEIDRACNTAVEQYDSPVESNIKWKSAWSTVMSRDELIATVTRCAEPQRSRAIELRAEADVEIDRACNEAIERYKSPVESSVRWNSGWSPVTTREELVNDVASCSERGRANAEAVDSEIERACGVAIERYRTPVSSLIRWKSAWSSVMSRDELIAAVEGCAGAARLEAIERADFLDSCARINVDKLEKNPDGLAGECYVVYGRIVQFDSATGPCSFHADIARNYSTNWWDYDTRSTFGYENNEILSALKRECLELDDIDVDDYIKVWATVLGSFSYETTAGGTSTVPSLRIEKVELVSKA